MKNWFQALVVIVPAAAIIGLSLGMLWVIDRNLALLLAAIILVVFLAPD